MTGRVVAACFCTEVWKWIDKKEKGEYTNYSDRSVETCEAHRRGRAFGYLPLFIIKMRNEKDAGAERIFVF